LWFAWELRWLSARAEDEHHDPHGGTFYLMPTFKVQSCASRGGTQMVKALSCTRSVRSEFSWLFGLVAVLFMMSMLSGCNTVKGMGEDVSATGDAMSNTAQDTEDKM
jgi:entericidin B